MTPPTKLVFLFSIVIAGSLPVARGQSPEPAKPAGSKAETFAASSTAPAAEELTRLLRQFLAGASNNELAAHQRFWADDLIYTSSSGRRLGKADIIREVTQEGPPKPGDETTVFSAEDIRIQQYDQSAIIAFRLVGLTTKGDKKERADYLNSGTLLKRDGKWQVVCWQATKLSPDDKR